MHIKWLLGHLFFRRLYMCYIWAWLLACIWMKVLYVMCIPRVSGLSQEDVMAGPECNKNLSPHLHAEKVWSYPLGSGQQLQKCLEQLCPSETDTSLLRFYLLGEIWQMTRLWGWQCLSDKRGSTRGVKSAKISYFIVQVRRRPWMYSGTSNIESVKNAATVNFTTVSIYPLCLAFLSQWK